MTPPYAFWYVYSTNGNDGFLVDLIRRPEGPVARLALYHNGAPPRILRRGFNSTDLQGTPGELGVRLGNFALDALGCSGGIDDVTLKAQFALSGRSMQFVPAWVASLIDDIPDFRSNYGTLQSGVCAGATYADAPLVLSTYTVGDLAAARWVLISCPRFEGSDLAFEISAAWLLGRWTPTAWVFFQGREYHLQSELDTVLHVAIARGGDIEDSERVFTGSIRTGDVHIGIDARAPVDQFARLDTEGQTEIQTTLFGTCRAAVSVGSAAGQVYTATRTCLLEVKN